MAISASYASSFTPLILFLHSLHLSPLSHLPLFSPLLLLICPSSSLIIHGHIFFPRFLCLFLFLHSLHLSPLSRLLLLSPLFTAHLLIIITYYPLLPTLPLSPPFPSLSKTFPLFLVFLYFLFSLLLICLNPLIIHGYIFFPRLLLLLFLLFSSYSISFNSFCYSYSSFYFSFSA